MYRYHAQRIFNHSLRLYARSSSNSLFTQKRSFAIKSKLNKPPTASSLKKKKKTEKVVQSLDDLIKAGTIQSASSMITEDLILKKEKQSENEIISKEDEKDPLIKGNIQTIGKCIKYLSSGEKYINWVSNNMDLLEEYNSLSTAKLRHLVAKTAKELFGFENLRPLQGEAIIEIIKPTKKPCQIIVLSGTGSGKSLIYWLSSVLQEFSATSKTKLSVIISPLVSLLNDQFNQLEPTGIPAAIYYGKVTAPARKTLFNCMKFIFSIGIHFNLYFILRY